MRRCGEIRTLLKWRMQLCFLASDLGRGVTGNVIYVDAGFQIMGLDPTGSRRSKPLHDRVTAPCEFLR